jgi:hypothetical protein
MLFATFVRYYVCYSHPMVGNSAVMLFSRFESKMLLDFNPGEDRIIISFNLPIVIVIQQGNSIQNRSTRSCSLLGLEVFGMAGFRYPVFESNFGIDQRLFGRSSGFVATMLDVFQEFLVLHLACSGPSTASENCILGNANIFPILC